MAKPLPYLAAGVCLAAAFLFVSCGGENADRGETSGGQLGDPQILGVLRAINRAEVDAARLAEQRASDANVKEFAVRMENAHSKANEKLADLGSPEESDLSRKLEEKAKQTMESLRNAPEDQFDERYMVVQVKMHENALDTVSDELLPAAKGEKVRQFVGTMENDISHHLERAKELNESLGGGGSEGGNGTSGR